MTTAESKGRTGRPPVTSRGEIMSAARRLIDRDGWEKLTIRRLAAELGVGSTTLYHHVRNKQDLLILLINEYAAHIERPALSAEPTERIVAAAVVLRDALADWPWAADVLTVDGFVFLLDESALWPVETIVGGAIDKGCTQQQAVDLFRSVWYFTVGEILVRAHTVRRLADEGHPARAAATRELGSPDLPHLAAIGRKWQDLAARDIYPHSVRALVEGLLVVGDPG